MLNEFSPKEQNRNAEAASDEKGGKSEVKLTGLPPIALREVKKPSNASELGNERARGELSQLTANSLTTD